MLEIVAHLEQHGYDFVENIVGGTDGSIFKVKQLKSNTERRKGR